MTTLYFFFWAGFSEIAAVELEKSKSQWPMHKNNRRSRR